MTWKHSTVWQEPLTPSDICHDITWYMASTINTLCEDRRLWRWKSRWRPDCGELCPRFANRRSADESRTAAPWDENHGEWWYKTRMLTPIRKIIEERTYCGIGMWVKRLYRMWMWWEQWKWFRQWWWKFVPAGDDVSRDEDDGGDENQHCDHQGHHD